MRFFSLLGKKRKPVRPAAVSAAKSASARTSVFVDNDSPWHPGETDELGRQLFATRIAETIAGRGRQEGLVVGVFGAAGEGRTSLLRMIEHTLNTRGKATTLWFNPWYFRGRDTLRRAFLSQLADKIQENLTENAGAFSRVLGAYADILSAPPHDPATSDPGKAARSAASRLGGSDVETLKKRLDGFMDAAATELVVLMDDTDRLDASELHEVLKLVTLVGALPRVTYVLALDDATVSAVIGEAGPQFLEKMVQVPLRLPQVSPRALVRVTLDMLNRALIVAGAQWTDAESREFQRAFVPLFQSRARSVRIGKRLANSVPFVLPLLRGEARIVDLLLIESLRVLLPDLHATIQRDKDLFTQGKPLTGGHRAADREKQWHGILASIPQPERAAAVDLLEHLFPMLRSITADDIFAPDAVEQWETEQRIVSEHYFDRYFTYAVPEGDVSDAAFDALLRQLAAGEMDAAERRFDEMMSGAAASRVIRRLTVRADQLPPSTAEMLFRLACTRGGDLPNATTPTGFRIPQQAGLAMAHQALLRIPSAGRGELVAAAMRECPSLAFATGLFQRLRHIPSQGQGATISAADEKRAGAILGERLDASFQQEPFYLQSDETAHLMLHIWKQLVGSDRATAAIRARLTARAGESGAFLLAFRNAAWSLDTGLPVKPGFDMDRYRAATAFVEPGVILQALVTAYGPYVETGSSADMEPALSGVAPGAAIGRQFAWLHKKG